MSDNSVRPAHFSIPDGINVSLVAAMYVLSVSLWWIGSVGSTAVFIVCLILFAFLFLTNFSLFHEASHHKLHSSPKWNYALGALCGILFPMPFSMFRVTHWNHHLRNRTDFEMFDLYYEKDSFLQKCLTWYGALMGAWYWIIPLGSAVLVFGPNSLRECITRHHKKIGDIMFEDFSKIDLTRARIEVLTCILFFAAILHFFPIAPFRLFLFYFVSPILWSTTQYIEHAYAPRDVHEGAFNLKASRWFSLVMLNRELDLNHHRFTELSWIHLPKVTEDGTHEIRYFWHYWRQWSGPQRVDTPAPPAIKDIVSDYSKVASGKYIR